MSYLDKVLRRFPARIAAEVVAVALATLWFARFAYLRGGFVVGSDMEIYLDVGLRRVADPFLINRYVHVYALRLAALLAGSTLAGMRLYSASVAGLTMILTYASARFLTKSANLANGTIAILLTLSIPLLVRLVLGPSVDTTLMVIVLAFVAIYLLYTRQVRVGPWMLVSMGVLFVFAIRSKEVAWALITFFPGLGITGSGSFSWSLMLQRLRFFGAGVVLGLLTVVIANAIFIGKPFFGLRPADISQYIADWSSQIRSKSEPASTLSQLVIVDNSTIFALYLAAGLWFGKSMAKPTRLIWLFPLALAGFLLIATTRTNWYIVPRGFLPGLAVMSLLASRILDVRLPPSRASISLLAVAVVIGAGLAIFGYVTKDGLTYSAYFQQALAPALLGIALALTIISQSRERSGWAVFVLLFAVAGFSAILNVRTITSNLEHTGWRSRYSLPLAFRDQMDVADPFDAFFSSESLDSILGADNRDELAVLVNVALDGATVRADYQIGGVDESLIQSMESAAHKYVVVTSSEWDWLRTAPQDRPEWRARYDAFEEPKARWVLLTLNEDE